MDEKQKDGVANAVDNIALGSLFGGIGGWFTDALKWYVALLLLVFAIAAYAIGYSMRKDGENNAS